MAILVVTLFLGPKLRIARVIRGRIEAAVFVRGMAARLALGRDSDPPAA